MKKASTAGAQLQGIPERDQETGGRTNGNRVTVNNRAQPLDNELARLIGPLHHSLSIVPFKESIMLDFFEEIDWYHVWCLVSIRLSIESETF